MENNEYIIPLDDTHYHINVFSQEELAWAKDILLSTFQQYSDLEATTNATLEKLNYTEVGKQNLLIQIVLAFSHAIKLSNPPKTKEQLCKTISKYFTQFLPVIAENNLFYVASHPIQYEPTIVAMIAFSNFINRNVSLYYDASNQGELTPYERYYNIEVINLARVIKSSILLYCIGDDVHGTSLFRGAMEIMAKLELAQYNQEDFVVFKDFNACLQYYKLNGDALPDEMVKYLKQFRNYKRNPENFLLYGWAKNRKGNRIMTMNELMETAYPENGDLADLLHVCGEFTHEDYANVNYDFIALRKIYLDYYFAMCYGICKNLSSMFSKSIRKELNFSPLKVLFHNATFSYSGALPLEEEEE